MSRRVTLPDGRGLGIAELGPADGPAILYFHGWPSSRLEPCILDAPGVRILAVDRPGYGLSDAAAGPEPRSLADWPRDIAALANALDLGRFAVFGMSGGVPYAAAVAAAMPERVSCLSLVSGIGPAGSPGADRHSMRLHLWLGRSRITRRSLFAAWRWLVLHDNGRLMQVLRGLLPRCDAAALTAERGRRLFCCWREGLSRSIEGATSDAIVYSRPWPFDPARIRVPTTIWHGEADSVVPAKVAASIARAIPAAALRLVPGEGHISLIVRHVDDILDHMLAHL